MNLKQAKRIRSLCKYMVHTGELTEVPTYFVVPSTNPLNPQFTLRLSPNCYRGRVQIMKRSARRA